MPSYSYDIVSELNISEINNVYDQVKRELLTRYDFKNTNSEIEWLSPKKEGFRILGSNELNIDSMIDIIRQKLAKRNLSQKSIDLSSDNIKSNLKITREIPFKFGLTKDQTKQINSQLKNQFPKIKSQILGESLRISSNSKDELQNSILFIRKMELDFPLQFINFK